MRENKLKLDFFYENPYGAPRPTESNPPPPPSSKNEIPKTLKSSRIHAKVNMISPKVNIMSPKVNVKYY